MSRATTYVRFQDGTVMWSIYDGTSDIQQPFLVDSMEEAWDTWRSGSDAWDCIDAGRADAEPVALWITYGGEWGCPAMASRSHRVITDGLDPWEDGYDWFVRDRPGWVDAALDAERPS